MQTIDMTDVLGLAALDFDLDPTPTVGVPEAQGDLLFVPWPENVAPAQRARDIAGAVLVVKPETVVRGRGGNEHMLVDPDGAGLLWHRYPDGSQTVGVLVVPDGARAAVDHREHGRSVVGGGVWAVRRQREQRDEIELVQD